MKKPFLILTILGILLCSCGPQKSISSQEKIYAPTSKVWDVMTNPTYAKILGAEFDKNAFVESKWELGSEVYFKYEPDKLVSTGTISKLVEEELIQVDYNLSGFKYQESYRLIARGDTTVLQVDAGPYTSDYEGQVIAWKNWQKKVKELSESE